MNRYVVLEAALVSEGLLASRLLTEEAVARYVLLNVLLQGLPLRKAKAANLALVAARNPVCF